MKFALSSILLAALLCVTSACSGNQDPATPVESLKAYTIAVKKKDTEMMKMLLSAESMKIHEGEAKAQNVSVDEIIQRETLFPEGQRVFDYRNETIDGKNATVEVKNDFGGWDMVYLVREGGLWKIDKKGFSEKIIDQNEEAERKLDDQIEKERQQTKDELDGTGSPDPNATPDDGNPTATPDSQTDPNDPANSPEITPNDAGDPAKTSG